MSLGTLIIRADATSAMGHGHVMRCLALAQAWQDRGGKCLFAVSQPPRAIAERVKAERCELFEVQSPPGSREDAGQLAELAKQNAARWIVMDGYHFGIEYQQVLKRAGLKLLVVDDYGQIGVYAADIVLDQNAGARDILYQNRRPDTQLLLGTRYAMLRREFKTWRDWRREVPPVARKILVTMGGSDPEDLTTWVARALHAHAVDNSEVKLVIGEGYPHRESLNALVAEYGSNWSMLSNATDMTGPMAWADIAIIAGGGTLWELLYMGCPVVTFARTTVQNGILSGLGLQGAAKFIGRAGNVGAAQFASVISGLASSPGPRRAMSTIGQSIIDGMGAERICEVAINGRSTGNHLEHGYSLVG